MPQILAIKFSEYAMPIHYDGNGLSHLRPEDLVLAEREGSEDLGIVAAIEWISSEQLKLRRKKYLKVIREANEGEKETFTKRRAFEKQALTICKERARQLSLPMKISSARVDGKDGRVVFQFTSEQRVDFRQLVRELSTILRARIELWQIGVRDEAKSIDGFGVCGLRTCCSQWMDDFNPINIRMAKTQDIHLPPSKLSGLCGRLLCCLSHEVDQYRDVAKTLKPKGATIEVEGERGVIIDRNIMNQTYVVLLETKGRVTVTSDEMGNIRIPEQMKKMSSLLDSDSKLSPKDDAEAPPKSSKPAPRSNSNDQQAEGDEKPRGRRRNRGNRNKSGSPQQKAKADQQADGENKNRPSKSPSGRRGNKRRNAGPKDSGEGSKPSNNKPRKQSAPQEPKAKSQGDGDKPKGRTGKRRGGRGRGGRNKKPDSGSPPAEG